MRNVGLITGAGRGLGRVLATFLAGQGYDLVITSRNASELAQTSESAHQNGSRIIAVAGDITSPDHRVRLLQETRTLGGLSLLVNNASDLGETPRPELSHASLDRFRAAVETNLVAPLGLIQKALSQLEDRKGTIINITSDASQVGYERWGTYGATKAALDLVSRTLAAELKPKGVAVVSVDPGDIRTRMHQDAFPNEDISDRPLPEVTLPFWAWLISQDPRKITGLRFQAQASLWEVPA